MNNNRTFVIPTFVNKTFSVRGQQFLPDSLQKRERQSGKKNAV